MTHRFLRPAALLFFTLASFTACDRKETATETTTAPTVKQEPAKPAVQAPNFNGDSAYAFVKKQVEFGPRVPNTSAHRQAGNYFAQKLKGYGLKVYEQEFTAPAFTGTQLQLRNIVAQYKPEAKNRILLAAHWDTRPYADKDDERQGQPIDGANDGGSGVGVLLEIARQLSLAQQQPNVGVDIVLFDGEDHGYDGENTDAVAKPAPGVNATTDTWCLGSQHWAKNLVPAGYTANYGILLDMVGARGARFAKEGLSRMYAGNVVNKVWTTASRLGYSSIFIPVESDPITDDHQYVMQFAKIPMIDIIEYNLNGQGYFGDYHHTHNDNLDIIDPATLKAVGQTVLQVIYNE